MTGQVVRSGVTTGGIELTLAPYEATVIVLGDDRPAESGPESRCRRLDRRGRSRGGCR